MTNKPINSRLFLFLTFNLFSSASASYASHFDLEDTPPNTYTKCRRPSIKRLPAQSILDMTPVKNQGPLGTCASFAVSACGELHYKPSGLRFSEAELTVLAETHLPPAYGGNCRPGINLGKTLKLGKAYGFVTEDKFSYNRYLTYVAKKNGIKTSNQSWIEKLRRIQDPVICTRVDGYTPIYSYNRTMTELGLNFRLYGTREDIGYQLPGVYPIHHVSTNALSKALQGKQATEKCIGTAGDADIEWVKYALSIGHPVATALPVFSITSGGNNWDSEQLIRNTVTLPSKGRSIGSHAVVLSGFNDSTQTFKLKNSWGPRWGDQGFAYIPYEYIRKYSTELVGVGNM